MPTKDGFAAEVDVLEESLTCKELGERAVAIGGKAGQPLYGTGVR